MSRWARKKDLSHKEVKGIFVSAGMPVFELNGALDFLVLDAGRVRIVDAKTRRKDGGKDELTPTQRRLIRESWPVELAHDADEAIALIVKWRRG